MPLCTWCGRRGLWKRCACTVPCFCSKECQNLHWPSHRVDCKMFTGNGIEGMIGSDFNMDTRDSSTFFDPSAAIPLGDVNVCPSMGMNHVARGEGPQGNVRGVSCLGSIVRNYRDFSDGQRLGLGVGKNFVVDGSPGKTWHHGDFYVNESKRFSCIIPPPGGLTFSVDRQRVVTGILVIDRRKEPDAVVSFFVCTSSRSEFVMECSVGAAVTLNDGFSRGGWRGVATIDSTMWESSFPVGPSEDPWNECPLVEFIRGDLFGGGRVDSATSPAVCLLTNGVKMMVVAPMTAGNRSITVTDQPSPPRAGIRGGYTGFLCQGCRAAGETGVCSYRPLGSS